MMANDTFGHLRTKWWGASALRLLFSCFSWAMAASIYNLREQIDEMNIFSKFWETKDYNNSARKSAPKHSSAHYIISRAECPYKHFDWFKLKTWQEKTCILFRSSFLSKLPQQSFLGFNILLRHITPESFRRTGGGITRTGSHACGSTDGQITNNTIAHM